MIGRDGNMGRTTGMEAGVWEGTAAGVPGRRSHIEMADANNGRIGG